MITAIALIILIGISIVILFSVFLEFDWDPFIPLSFVGLAFLIRVYGPVLDIIFRGPANIPAMLNFPLSYLLIPTLVVVIASLAFVIGFLGKPGKEIGHRLPRFHHWDSDRARKISLVYAVIGTLFFLYFASHFEITTFADLSAKRDFSKTAYIRYLARFLEFGALILFLTYLHDGRELLSWQATPLWLLVAFAVSYPLFSSTRGPILAFLIMMVASYHYYRHQIPLYKLSFFGIVSMILAGIVAGIRSLSQTGTDLSEYIFETAIVTILFQANYGGITAFSHIVHEFPADRPLRWGTTFLRWISYPIPSFWQENQPMKLGREIAIMFYGRPNQTPGMILGELWMNYWLFGVIVGMVLLGIVSRIAYEYLMSDPEPHIATVGLYVIFVTQFLFFIITSSSTQMLEIIQWTIPMIGAFIYISHAPSKGLTWPDDQGSYTSYFDTSYITPMVASGKLRAAYKHSVVIQFGFSVYSVVIQFGFSVYSQISQKYKKGKTKFKIAYESSTLILFLRHQQ